MVIARYYGFRVPSSIRSTYIDLPRRQYYGGGSARVLVRSVEPELLSNKLFMSRQQVFSDHSDRCANALEMEEELDSRHSLRPHTLGSWSATLRRAMVKEVNNDEFAVDAVTFQPRFSVSRTHLHPPPVPAPTASLWKISEQSRLAFAGHCRLKLEATQRTGQVHVCSNEDRVRSTRFETAVCLKAASCPRPRAN